MPAVSVFFGITIPMYYRDHPPPHLHAWYQGQEALIDIQNGVVLAGAIPRRALRIVREWIDDHRMELMANWGRGEGREPFELIPGADVE